MFSASHLSLFSNVTLPLELINNQEWCQRKRKWDEILFPTKILVFSKSWFSSHKREVACSSFMSVACFEHCSHIRQKWQEEGNYWSNYRSVSYVLAWVRHNFSKEILEQQWFDWRCSWNCVFYVVNFSNFWKNVENTIVLSWNIWQWS